MTLNVMVLENEPNAAAEAAQELRAAGHAVLSCHEEGSAVFPCRGIAHPSTCPLRSHAVDVALVVRVGGRGQPTLGEDGARCALIHRVPLVVAGAPFFDPFDEYATRTVDHIYGVVDACERAASAPIEELGRRATAVLHAVIGASDAGEPAPRADVTRRDGRLMVHIQNGETMTKDERARAAIRITMALRELDPYAAGIDVAVVAAVDHQN